MRGLAGNTGAGLTVLCAAQFVVVLDATVVATALPAIRTDLGFGPAGLSWVVTAYTVALAGLLLIGGRAADLGGAGLVDRRGRRWRGRRLAARRRDHRVGRVAVGVRGERTHRVGGPDRHHPGPAHPAGPPTGPPTPPPRPVVPAAGLAVTAPLVASAAPMTGYRLGFAVAGLMAWPACWPR